MDENVSTEISRWPKWTLVSDNCSRVSAYYIDITFSHLSAKLPSPFTFQSKKERDNKK